MEYERNRLIQEQQLMNSDKYLGQKLKEINDMEGQKMQFQANSTKMDFPMIQTRGKVMENRTDLELEAKGSIFQGRDEKSILIRKKEDSQ